MGGEVAERIAIDCGLDDKQVVWVVVRIFLDIFFSVPSLLFLLFLSFFLFVHIFFPRFRKVLFFSRTFKSAYFFRASYKYFFFLVSCTPIVSLPHFFFRG